MWINLAQQHVAIVVQTKRFMCAWRTGELMVFSHFFRLLLVLCVCLSSIFRSFLWYCLVLLLLAQHIYQYKGYKRIVSNVIAHLQCINKWNVYLFCDCSGIELYRGLFPWILEFQKLRDNFYGRHWWLQVCMPVYPCVCVVTILQLYRLVFMFSSSISTKNFTSSHTHIKCTKTAVKHKHTHYFLSFSPYSLMPCIRRARFDTLYAWRCMCLYLWLVSSNHRSMPERKSEWVREIEPDGIAAAMHTDTHKRARTHT